MEFEPIKYENVKEQIIELLDNMQDDASGRKREFYNVTTSDKRKIEVLRLSLKDVIYFEYIKTTRKIRIVDNINKNFLEAIDIPEESLLTDKNLLWKIMKMSGWIILG